MNTSNALTIPENETYTARIERQGLVVHFCICIGGAAQFTALQSNPQQFWAVRWDALADWQREWLTRAACVPLTLWVVPVWHCMGEEVREYICRKTSAMARSAEKNWPQVLKVQAA